MTKKIDNFNITRLLQEMLYLKRPTPKRREKEIDRTEGRREEEGMGKEGGVSEKCEA